MMKVETIHGEVTVENSGRGPFYGYMHAFGYSIADRDNRQMALDGPTCYRGSMTDSRVVARAVVAELNRAGGHK